MSDSDTETNLAVAALIVALVALFMTLGQLLQQYLATADGYRRCQPSVMGPWAKRTRLQWRWSQFRFETYFTTPFICLYPFNQQSIKVIATREDRAWIAGGILNSFTQRVFPLVSGTFHGADIDCVSWLWLLRATHKCHELLLKGANRLQTPIKNPITNSKELYYEMTFTIPTVQFEERSWDFMPPEVTKPYARAPLATVVVLARRLGMTWIDFEPHEGVMKAEGNGFILVSTYVRSVGTMLTFASSAVTLSTSDWLLEQMFKESSFVPTDRADALGFGVIITSSRYSYGRERYDVSKRREMIDTVNSFARLLRRKQITQILTNHQEFCPGFSDLLPLAMPLLKEPNSPLYRIPCPGDIFKGVMYERCIPSFRNQVRKLLDKCQHVELSSQLKWVLDQILRLDNLDNVGTLRWIAGCGNPRIKQLYTNARYQETFYNICEQIEQRFLDFEKGTTRIDDHRERQGFRYFDLVHCHVERVMLSYVESKDDKEYDISNDIETQEPPNPMVQYFRLLPRIVEDMRNLYDFDEDAIIIEAWVKMIFRGILWYRMHYMVRGQIVPSRYYESDLPVYIG